MSLVLVHPSDYVADWGSMDNYTAVQGPVEGIAAENEVGQTYLGRHMGHRCMARADAEDEGFESVPIHWGRLVIDVTWRARGLGNVHSGDCEGADGMADAVLAARSVFDGRPSSVCQLRRE